MIGKRLSRLSAECNQALAVAAVIGRDFALDTLRLLDVSGSEEALVSALEEAVRVGVLDDQSRGGAVRFRFSHAFFRQTLYEEIFTPRRLRLHQDVARALERQHAARLDEHAAELAEHFAQSSDPADLAKAVKYGELAAGRAMAVYAYGEAVHHWQQALLAQEVLDPDDKAKQCDLLLALGKALGPAGEAQRASDEVAPRALALAEALGDRDRAAACCEVALEGLHRYSGVMAYATDSYREWAERAGHFGGPGSRARVLADGALAHIHMAKGEPSQVVALVSRALETARQLDEPETLFWAAGLNLMPTWPVSQRQQRRLIADEFLIRSRDGISSRTLSAVLLPAQIILLVEGDRVAAEAVWRELEQLAERTQDANLLFLPHAFAALRNMLDGHLEEALEAVKRIERLGEQFGQVYYPGLAAGVARRPLFYLGRAEETLGGAVDPPRWLGANAHALCLVHTGRHEEAQRGLNAYMEGFTDAVLQEAPAEELCTFFEIAVLLGDLPTIGRLYPRLDGLSGVQRTTRYEFINVARLLGDAARLLGEPSGAALAHYQRSLEWATGLRFRPEIALSRLGIAELLLGKAIRGQPSAVSDEVDEAKLTADKLKAEGSQHLDFAIEEFRAMKMQPSLERALRHKGLLTA